MQKIYIFSNYLKVTDRQARTPKELDMTSLFLELLD